MAAGRLSPRTLAFVHEYVWGKHAGVGSRSVLAAGLAKGNLVAAEKYASQLIRRPVVVALLEKELAEKKRQLKQRAAHAAEVSYQRAVADPGEALDEKGEPIPLHLMPPAIRRAVKSVKILYEDREVHADDGVTVKRIPRIAEMEFHDSRADRELFLKYSGELKDEVKHTGSVAISIIDPYAEPKKEPKR